MSQDVICDYDFECSNSTIRTSDNIECNGYKSCINNEVIESYYGDIRCDGSYSCTNTQNITVPKDYQEIYCGGASSCRNCNSIMSRMTVWCDGINSCTDSNTLMAGIDDVECDGENSCSNTNILNSDDIEHYGAYSGQNSIVFNSINNDGFSQKLEDDLDSNLKYEVNCAASYAGYNSTFICNKPVNKTFYRHGSGEQVNVECELLCYGNGCYKSRMLCHSNVTCKLYIDEADNGTFPQIYYFNNSIANEILGLNNYNSNQDYNGFITPNNVDFFIKDYDNKFSDNTQEKLYTRGYKPWVNIIDQGIYYEPIISQLCDNYNYNNSSNNDILCCNGHESCKDMNYIYNNSNNNNNNNNEKVPRFARHISAPFGCTEMI